MSLDVRLDMLTYSTGPGSRVPFSGSVSETGENGARVPVPHLALRIEATSGVLYPQPTEPLTTDDGGHFSGILVVGNALGPVTVRCCGDHGSESGEAIRTLVVSQGALPPGDIAGVALSGLLSQEVAAARQESQGLEQKGKAVVTTSGAFVAALAGILSIVSGGKPVHLDGAALWLGAAAILLALSAICAIFTNWPRHATALIAVKFKKGGWLEPETWYLPYWPTARRVQGVLLDELADEQRRVGAKRWFLWLAMALEAAAFLCLALLVVIVVLTHP